MENVKIYSKEELALRNGLVGTQAWIGYKGHVYDVSSSPLFQHGKHYRLKVGQDLTEYMSQSPHLEHVLEKFPIVGLLLPQ